MIFAADWKSPKLAYEVNSYCLYIQNIPTQIGGSTDTKADKLTIKALEIPITFQTDKTCCESQQKKTLGIFFQTVSTTLKDAQFCHFLQCCFFSILEDFYQGVKYDELY